MSMIIESFFSKVNIEKSYIIENILKKKRFQDDDKITDNEITIVKAAVKFQKKTLKDVKRQKKKHIVLNP